MLAATIAFQAVGEMVGAATAWMLLKRWPEPHSWRWLLGSGAAFALLLLLTRLPIPESPHWLMQRGRNQEASTIIASLSDLPASAVLKLGRQAGEQRVDTQDSSAQQDGGLGLLFSPAYRRVTVLTAGRWFLMDIASYGVGLFTPIILAPLVAAPRGSVTGVGVSVIADEFHTISGTGLVDGFLLAGSLLGIVLVPPLRADSDADNRLSWHGGRHGVPQLRVSSAGADQPPHRLGVSGLHRVQPAGERRAKFHTFLLPVNLYQTSVRATGAGFAAAFSKVGATLGIFRLPIVRHTAGITIVMVLMVAVSLLAWLLTVVFSRHLPRNPDALSATPPALPQGQRAQA